MGRYRIVEGYGQYFNLRFEVQRKYFYYDASGKRKASWHTVYHSRNIEDCERVLEKYLTIPKKTYKIPELVF